MYRKQFLLTTQPDFRYNWNYEKIGHFILYHHPDLSYSFKKGNDADIYLLGELYDWENPQFSNQQILEALTDVKSINELLSGISKYSGEYVLVCKFDQDIYIFNDACSQAEIYYDENFSSFGTQPKLLGEVIDLLPHEDAIADEFYKSAIFKKKCLFIGESTHKKNIRHLLPNHFVHINDKKVKRFFPVIPSEELTLEDAADQASLMLKGYLKAISLRNDMALAVTGGYDSRNNKDDVEEYVNSIDFPRFIDFSVTDLKNKVLVNGNVSEIARNYFGYHRNITPEELSSLNGYKSVLYPSIQYKHWLKVNKPLFSKLGYNYLDMFYWEEKMGNWGAKAKTEFNALNKTVTSPFN
jgi:hypothetical protein